MAQFTINTTAEQDAAGKYFTDRHNQATGETLTPLQYVRERIGELFNNWVDRWKADTATTNGEAYRELDRAADAGDPVALADRSALVSILDKYR